MTVILLDPPGILQSAADRMGALSTSTGKAEQYVETYAGELTTQDGGLAFSCALSAHGAVVAKALDNIERSGRLLRAVSSTLTTAQDRYNAAADDSVVAVSDIFRVLGGGATPDLGSRGTGTAFGTTIPADDIGAPGGFAGIPWWTQMIIELGGSLVSPTYWFEKILSWTIGVDPIEEVLKFFFGEWKTVAQAGGAFDKIGDYWTSMSNAVADDCGVLFRGWTGDAAHAAEGYFARLIQAFAEQSPALSELGSKYSGMGAGMYFTIQGVGTLMGTILDLVAGAAILAAAIVVATASGVGAPAALAMTSALTAMLEGILGIWAEVLTVQGFTVGACYTFAGVLGAYANSAASVDQVEMPDAI